MRRYVDLFRSLIWIGIWLAILDVGINFALRRYAVHHPDASIVRYFEYGRSIEDKLTELTDLPPTAVDALILGTGWLDPSQWDGLLKRPQPGKDLLVAVYGQSFANKASDEAARLDGGLTLREVGGPSAPPDHSFAAYELDDAGHHADVVVFGILASSVPRMGCLSSISSFFEHPVPYTYPHYRLTDGSLVAEQPVITTEAQFRQAFKERGDLWHQFKSQLHHNDRGYDPIAFNSTPLDTSKIVLLLRRGWVAQTQDYNLGVYDSAHGFNSKSEPIQVLKKMLAQLKLETSSRHQQLIVLLEHDQGYGGALVQALGKALADAQIDFVSTQDLFSASDPHNFIPDKHYTDAANHLLAKALLEKIRRQ